MPPKIPPEERARAALVTKLTGALSSAQAKAEIATATADGARAVVASLERSLAQVQGARHVMVLEPLSDQLPPRPHFEKQVPVAAQKGGRR